MIFLILIRRIVMKISILGILWAAIFNIRASEALEIDGIFGQFVVDMTTSLYASSSFTAFLCSNTDDTFEFSRFISKNHKLHEIVKLPADYAFNIANSMLAHQNFYVVDFDCPGSYGLLIEADRSAKFVAPTKWLILQDLRFKKEEINQTTLSNMFGEFHMLPDSEVIIGQRNEQNVVNLLSIYRPSALRGLIVEERGIWNDLSGIQLRDHHASSRRRSDLQQTPLKACAVITNPDTMNHLEDFKDKQVDLVTKVGYTLSKLLVARMNATVNFTFTSTWGYKEKNGTWSGLTGELVRGEVDFGATGTFIVQSRLGVIDYIHLYTPNRIRFIFRRPPLSNVSNLFTLPFSRAVWIAVFIFCSSGFLLLYFSMAWEWKEVENIPLDEKFAGDLEVKPAFGDSFLILLGAITQQGSAYEPRTVPARIIIFILLILCLNLYAAYTANIVALLQSSSDSIKTVRDLTYGPLKTGVHDIVYNHHYFGSFEDSMRKELYERRVQNQKNVWMTLEEGIEKVRYELFAFHTETSLAYDIVQCTYGEDEKCGFEEIDYLYVPDPTFIIKHKSPYREIFRVGARWLEETGIKQRYVNILYSKKPMCNNRKKFMSVGTTECYAAYLTIGYGMAITFGILIIEILWSKSCDPMEIGSIEQLELTKNSPSAHISEVDEYVDNEFHSVLD